ncbi:MAG: membrane protease subunit HflK, partial [Myxococcota bacterium]
FLHNLAPAMVFPLAWWVFKEKPGSGTIAGAAVAFVGVAMLSGVSLFHFAHFTNPRFLLGDLLAVGSAVGYAAVLVLTRAIRQEGTPLLTTLFVAWSTAAVMLVGLALAVGTMAISPGALLWVAGLAVICTNVPFYLLSRGMKDVNAGLASLLSMTEILFATLIGVLLYREDLAPIGWLGGGVVVLGVLYPFFSPQSAPEPVDGETTPLSDPATAQARWMRLGTALVLFNAGAVMSLLYGMGAGALLAFIGSAMLLRLGPPAAMAGLEGRFARGLRFIFGGLAAAVAGGLAMRGGLSDSVPGLLPAAMATLALLADSALAARESESERDPNHSLHVALAAVALSQLAGLGAHPAAGWLTIGAAIFTALALLRPLAGSLKGGARWWDADTRGDRPAQWLARPTRALPVLLVFWLAGGFSTVPLGHRGIVSRFGEPRPETSPPGLLLRIPPPIEQIRLVDVSVQRRVELNESGQVLLCGDQSMISLSGALHYTVSDALRYADFADDPDETLRLTARSALVTAIAALPQDAVLTDQRAAVESEVLALTRKRAEAMGLGVSPEALHLTHVAVPAPVMDAFLDVISASEERSTLINKAEAYAAGIVPGALGEAAAIHQRAEGGSATTSAATDAWLAHFHALSTGGVASPALTRHRLRQEHLESTLSGRRLVIAEDDVSIWLGGTHPTLPTPEEAP